MVNHMKKANELLRSAHAIASRDGVETNWGAFKDSVEALLVEQSEILNGTTHIPAATCTARIYKTNKE